MANYVKFMRGTPTAYENLRLKEEDTLYFISESDAATGKLYIGDKLINAEMSQTDFKIYLNKLEDVDISGAKQNDLLGYDEVSQKWIPVNIDSVISIPIMTGATLNQDGKKGLVPAPVAGDENKFLRGDGSWITIQQGASLKYKKVSSIEEIDTNAEDASEYIYLVAKDNQYEEYLVIDNKTEAIGALNVSLDNYATKEELKQTTSNVQDIATSLGQVITKVINIENSLNNYVNVVSYNEKIAQIDQDISDLKKSTTWGKL